MSFFPAAFALIIGVEGGYSHDPLDPGGETKYGISKRQYPNLDIAHLTLEQAQTLYERDYWAPLGCDSLSWEMALVLFDCGVNQGVGTAKAIHIISPTAIEVQAQRALRYAHLPTFGEFGHGWMRRLFTIFKAAQNTPP